jgi:hypothetical protein
VDLFCCGISLLAFPLTCSSKSCPEIEIFIAKQLPELKTWKVIYGLHNSFPECDDGAYAEGYSDFVVRTLVRQ